MNKSVWTMIDICKIAKKVDFGEPCSKEDAILMWLNEEYLEIIDEDELEIIDFVEAK